MYRIRVGRGIRGFINHTERNELVHDLINRYQFKATGNGVFTRSGFKNIRLQPIHDDVQPLAFYIMERH